MSFFGALQLICALEGADALELAKDRRRRAAKGKSAKQKRTLVGVRFRCALMARRYMRKGRMNAKWKAENRKQ